MTPAELQQILTVAGLEARVHGQEVQVRVCTSCGNEKWNLELNAERGLLHCWACRTGGRLDQWLRRLTGQEHHIPVVRDGPRAAPSQLPAAPPLKTAPIAEIYTASRYLERRGISAVVAAQYGMGVCVDEAHQLYGRIVIPAHDYWTNTIVGWIGRSYTGKFPKYLSTMPHRVITGWRGRGIPGPVVVVEGPLDGVAAHQAGFDVAVLSGIGSHEIVEWAARLDPAVPVAVMLDGDAVAASLRLYWQMVPLRSAGVVRVPLAAGEDPSLVGPARIHADVTQALRALAPTV